MIRFLPTARSRVVRHLLAFALAGAFFPVAAIAPAAELILNGSIEQYHGLGRPYAWTFRKNAAATVNTSPARSRTGANSLAFDLSIADGPEWDSRRYPVKPGRRYRARFWYRVDEVFSAGDLATFVRWWADDSWGDWRGQAPLESGIGRRRTSGWIGVDEVVTPPGGVHYAELHLWGVGSARGPRGRAYLDDFSLSTLPGPSGAGSPQPPDGAEEVPLHAVLSWDREPEAESYDLYLGEDHEAVLAAGRASASFRLSVPAGGSRLRYAASLAPYTRYFWRRDAVTGSGTRRGEVLSFATAFDLLEDIAGATAARYGARDDRGVGLDVLQVIENPSGSGYLGVYHHRIGSEFEARLATSTNLVDWTYRRTLARNADMPAIAALPSGGGFLLAHEQWGNPGSRSPSNLRFRHYASLSDLLAARADRDFTAPLTRAAAAGSDLEGTPSFFDVSASSDRVEVGFHFFDARGGGVDRNARGTLRGFLSGRPTWGAARWDELNRALEENEATANIGDRDDGFLFGRRRLLVEGQYVRGDFGSWRGWFWDFDRGDVFPLYPRTRRGSKAVGNMSWTRLSSPRGRRALFGACFLFSEGAAPGEAGEVIFYHELQTSAWGPSPASGSTEVSTRPRLYWLSGAGAASHDVYLGRDRARVARATHGSPEYRGRFDRPLHEPEDLAAGATYGWRVDEVFTQGDLRDGVPAEEIAAGAVWTFRTTDAGRSLPGDCNLDGGVDISDAICLLSLLFLGSGTFPCGGGRSASGGDVALLDWNGDAEADLSDAVAELGFLFGSPSGAPHILGSLCAPVAGCPAACSR